MNAKPTLFVAVALSALAAVLASSAQARIPEGNGTQAPLTLAYDYLIQQGSEGFSFFTPDPKIYEVYGADGVLSPAQADVQLTYPAYGALAPAHAHVQLARKASRKLVVDAKICANLDRAIALAIQQCLSHPVPLAVKAGTDQAQLDKFPDGYRGRT